MHFLIHSVQKLIRFQLTEHGKSLCDSRELLVTLTIMNGCITVPVVIIHIQ